MILAMKTTIRPLALGMASAAAIFLITYVSIQMATNSTSTTSANTSIDNNLPPEASSILLLPTKKAKAGHDILSSTSPACINDSAFFHGSVAKQTCAWIASRQDRVLSFCQSEAVRSNCPQVCGICCVDAPDFKFELNRGGAVLIEKTCLWLKRKEVRQERYCDNERIKNACPFSCGDSCPSYVPIVNTKNAGPSSTCTDNKYYSMSGGGRKKTCHWMGLDDTRRSVFCQSEEVRNNCPFSCGECCEDDVQYTFTVKRGLQKKCKWLGQKTVRQERYCNVVMDDHGSAVSAGCQAACGTCKSPYDETSDDDCGDTKATKAPGKGGKGIKSPTSQKNIAGKKAPKQGKVKKLLLERSLQNKGPKAKVANIPILPKAEQSLQNKGPKAKAKVMAKAKAKEAGVLKPRHIRLPIVLTFYLKHPVKALPMSQVFHQLVKALRRRQAMHSHSFSLLIFAPLAVTEFPNRNI
uniref:ShKT domain-containing protein n=1 Tax=Chaetoceros debilis TaxID=122233 RepID=A0A7S3QGJ4_9STRA